jgi:predicted small secreted protein
MNKLVVLSIIVWLAALAGCGTMQGLGKDIELLGERIQQKAQR